MDEVYAGIVEDLVAAAAVTATVLYAVPGSPLVAERTVELLRADPRVEVEVRAGAVLPRSGLGPPRRRPARRGVRLVDGDGFAAEAAGDRPAAGRPVRQPQVLVRDQAGARRRPAAVRCCTTSACPTSRSIEVAWAELDRRFEPDHLTCPVDPRARAAGGSELVALDELVRTLRERCPWDRAPDPPVARPPPPRGDLRGARRHRRARRRASDAHLEEELGDLLFQVVFHAMLAAEAGSSPSPMWPGHPRQAGPPPPARLRRRRAARPRPSPNWEADQAGREGPRRA